MPGRLLRNDGLPFLKKALTAVLPLYSTTSHVLVLAFFVWMNVSFVKGMLLTLGTSSPEATVQPVETPETGKSALRPTDSSSSSSLSSSGVEDALTDVEVFVTVFILLCVFDVEAITTPTCGGVVVVALALDAVALGLHTEERFL